MATGSRIQGASHSRREVCGRGGRFRGVRVEGGAPDGTLVTHERPDPVARVSLPEHRLAI